jgi:hypothetical protein
MIMALVVNARETIFAVLIGVFIVFVIRENDVVLLAFVVCVEKRDKSIVLCYSTVRNTDLQI